MLEVLVVVDKLLTGFDAPPCTYLYLDKRMQDHGLFQAICRTNRLDGEDKKFDYVVDYRDLFQKLVNDEGTGALQVYSSELDHSAPGASPEVVMENRITKGRKQLDEALEAVELLCGPVMPPREEKDFIRYFCGNTEKAGDLAEREPVRVALYWAQPREPRRELLNRESHYLWGERYLLNVVEREAPPEVRLRPRELTLQVREGAGTNAREAVLSRWYRDQLRERVAKLLEVWAPRVGEWPAQVHVQRMKTKWGSCHPGRRAIRLNTELAKKPPECLEYVLVHELVHLREANHGPRFHAILDEVMPMWREHRDALNDAPLAHVDWEY